ncbi:hypothetical protein [Myxococcus sp. Y35]|uniref:hypothetical protein n=1 Tax=Pseudomyxococcus flavus TaxID=3115648 RepID=UPI003CF060A6
MFVLAVAACGPDGAGTGGSRQGFRPRDSVVDFGRVLEGTQVRRAVTVLATGRAGVTVASSVDGPFAVVTPEVRVPGSGAAEVEVVFSAGHGPAEGTLALVGAGVTASVRLTGTGVRPTPCPERPCFTFHFDVVSGACVETPLEEGAACTSENRCEVEGRCQSGVCVGSPRTCDDDNPCTVDACSPTRGCVTTRVSCPTPENPCQVGVCDRDEGCTAVDVDDFVPCGPVDCQLAHLCVSGTCRQVTPPEGFVCAPATACQGEGACQGGVCERPEPAELEPELRLELEGAPVSEAGGPVLLVDGDAVFTSVCGGDAGCQLVAYTGSGLLRYASAYPEGGARTLIAASDAGVVVRAEEGLEGYAPRGVGERLWQASWSSLGADAGTWRGGSGTGHVALTESGDVLAYVSWGAAQDAGASDGGGGVPESARLVWLAGREDAGTVMGASPVEDWSGEARLGIDAEGTAYLYTVDGRLRRVEAVDGGAGQDGGALVELSLTPLLDAGVPDGGASLAITEETLLVGGRAFVQADASVQTVVDWNSGPGTRVPLAEPALLSPSGTVAYLFARACERTDGLPCTPAEERVVLRAVESGTGHTAWEVDALPDESLPGTVYEAAVLQGDTVGVLADAESPGDHRTWLQFFARGARVGMCPLPEHPRVAGAAFVGPRMYVVLVRDGAWMLESYGLGPDMEAEASGWPQRHGGSAGARRESP